MPGNAAWVCADGRILSEFHNSLWLQPISEANNYQIFLMSIPIKPGHEKLGLCKWLCRSK